MAALRRPGCCQKNGNQGCGGTDAPGVGPASAVIEPRLSPEDTIDLGSTMPMTMRMAQAINRMSRRTVWIMRADGRTSSRAAAGPLEPSGRRLQVIARGWPFAGSSAAALESGSSLTRSEARAEAPPMPDSSTRAFRIIIVSRATASPLLRRERCLTSSQGSMSCLESMDITLNAMPFFWTPTSADRNAPAASGVPAGLIELARVTRGRVLYLTIIDAHPKRWSRQPAVTTSFANIIRMGGIAVKTRYR
jgi:hypothetical protein